MVKACVHQLILPESMVFCNGGVSLPAQGRCTMALWSRTSPFSIFLHWLGKTPQLQMRYSHSNHEGLFLDVWSRARF